LSGFTLSFLKKKPGRMHKMVALLTATRAEAFHTLAELSQPERLEWGGGRFTLGRIDGFSVAAGWTGTGTTIAALSTQYLCDRMRPSALFFAGIGGALRADLSEGQVVTAREVMQWDIDAEPLGIGRGILPGEKDRRGKALKAVPTDEGLRRGILKIGGGNIKEGMFISGNRFIDLRDPESHSMALINGMEADIADMESIGPALAGYFNGIPTLLFRVVGDTISGSRPANYRAFVDDASRTIFSLFRRMLPAVKK
jgi:nucleoside phosphorylase